MDKESEFTTELKCKIGTLILESLKSKLVMSETEYRCVVSALICVLNDFIVYRNIKLGLAPEDSFESMKDVINIFNKIHYASIGDIKKDLKI